MKKAVLADELRKLERNLGQEPEYIIESMSDDEIIDSYVSCADCGEKALSDQNLDDLISKCKDSDAFLTVLESISHHDDPEDQNTIFLTEISGYKPANEAKIKKAVQIAAPGLLNVQKTPEIASTLFILNEAPPDFNGFDPYMAILPNVICGANEAPCNVITALVCNDFIDLRIRFPKKGLTITSAERKKLGVEKNHGFGSWIDKNATTVSKDSYFARIKEYFGRTFPMDFRMPDDISVSKMADSSELFVDFSWYEDLYREDDDIYIDRSEESFDLSSGSAESDVSIEIFGHNKGRAKHIRKDLEKYIGSNLSHSVKESSAGHVLTLRVKTAIPFDPDDKKEAAMILMSRIGEQNGEACAGVVSFGDYKSLIMPVPMLGLPAKGVDSNLVIKSAYSKSAILGHNGLLPADLPERIDFEADQEDEYAVFTWDKSMTMDSDEEVTGVVN